MDRIEASPDIFPEHVDMVQRTITHCEMDRASYLASPFLDHRIVRKNDSRRQQGFDDLPPLDGMPAPGPVNYIFHNAFCCSTLLTRYLEEIPGTLVLREPHSLFELASCRRFSGTALMQQVPESEQDRLLQYLVLLLSRRYQPSDAVIIKPTDGCNNLIRKLLQGNPDNRAVLLYSDAERFITSVLRVSERDEWAKVRVRELSMDKWRRQGAIETDPTTLGRGQTAALVWALHMEHFRELLQQPVHTPPLCINSEDLVQDRERVLARVTKHFRMRLSAQDIAAIARQSGFDRNAKAQNERYDADSRNNDYKAARTQHGVEIESALGWLDDLYGTAFLSDPLAVRDAV